MNWREVATRAVLTFVQAFLAVLLVDGLNGIDSWETLQPAVIAAVAALLSMLYRVVREYQASKGWEE
jgi:predicted RNA-binding protein with PIN domain